MKRSERSDYLDFKEPEIRSKEKMSRRSSSRGRNDDLLVQSAVKLPTKNRSENRKQACDKMKTLPFFI